ncbi:DUF1990 family protein [Streptomyces sp. 769]|uniref:DUF1990 family protein n=1 Tax=Streptomyces sp. 769 TaxID=1262452 RepID=UPI000582104D|nr:DUF1990 family protein [Streptomyces sp. 769]AJC54526.1 hypothetical protein GZL_01932 [Streptomyces sp. 769]
MTDGDLTYPERGGTRRSPLPPGYRPLREAVRLGHGRAVFAAAGDAVAGFRMHRAAGTRIRADAPRAAPGVAVDVSVGQGPVVKLPPASRRLARTLSALSGSSRYARYRDDPPP